MGTSVCGRSLHGEVSRYEEPRGILRLFGFSWMPVALGPKERPEGVWGLFCFSFLLSLKLFPWDLRWFQLLKPEALHTLLEPTFALLGGTFYHGVLSFQPVFFWFVSIDFPSRLSRMLKNQACNRKEPLCAGVSSVLNTLLGSLHPLILHWSFIYPVHIY